jgi:peptide/nickel transport system substrate-binding protein
MIFRYNEAAGIATLDPAFARDMAHTWVFNQLYNGLVQLDDSLNVVPSIAKNWTISEDGLTYTFSLRDDVFFHDSEVFNSEKRRVVAEDFVFSFNRLLDSKTASPGAWVLGAVDIENGEPAIFALKDTTLQIKLSKPFPPFLGILAMQYCSVIPKEAIDFYGKEFRNHPVGTGPFYLQNWEENVKMVLRKNEHYFEKENGQQLPYLDAVSISFVVDKMTSFLEFSKGNIDMISGIDPSYKDELLTRDGKLQKKYEGQAMILEIPFLNTEYFGILVDTTLEIVRKSPLKDRRVRQAVNYAIDREKMIKFLRNGVGSAGTKGMIPKGMPAYDENARYGFAYNPQKSRDLLKEAGFSQQNPLPPIDLVTTPDYLEISKFVQGQLLEVGIRMEIEVSPPAAIREMKAMSKVNFFRASWIADYPDEENYLSLFYSENFAPNGPNYTHYMNSGFDKLYQQSFTLNSRKDRTHLYREMDSLMMEDASVVVLYYDESLRFIQKNVKGMTPNPINLLNLKTVWKE